MILQDDADERFELGRSRANQALIPSVIQCDTIRKVRGLIVICGDSIICMESRGAQIQKAFGERIRELRKQKGLSQEALALACELDRTYIGGVERGERNISLLNIQRIADALGIPARELLSPSQEGDRS